MSYLDSKRSCGVSKSTNGLNKYRPKDSTRRTINLRYKTYSQRGIHFKRAGGGSPTIGVEKKNKFKVMFITDPGSSWQEAGAAVGIYHIPTWGPYAIN